MKRMILLGLMMAAVTVAQVEAKAFDVTDYGAKGDDKTDNTEAFSACLKDIIEAGGGRMVIPDGVYRGRISIPGTKEWITVEIVGARAPAPVFGTIGAFPLQRGGTIIKSLKTSGPAVISAQNKPGSLYQSFSGVYVVIRNLEVRTYDNPAISGINLIHSGQCMLENVFINTDIYNMRASEPTHGTSGLITPANGNAAWTVLRRVLVSGYYNGIVVHEHTDGDSIVVAGNVNGLNFAWAHHSSRFARVGAFRNTHHIMVTGRHGFSIAQMDTEQPGGKYTPGAKHTDEKNAWQTLVSDVHDPGNLGVGDINYWVVEGGVGARDIFTKNGGAGIRTRRIGSGQSDGRPPISQPEGSPASASSQFSPDHHAGKAADGDPGSFWASANGQDVGSWWQLDLGESTDITGVQIQFRGFAAAGAGPSFQFVPATITFQVSDDGKDWTTVIEKSRDLPANGSPYSDQMREYALNVKGRYFRLFFEDGVNRKAGSVKAVELTEVKVIR